MSMSMSIKNNLHHYLVILIKKKDKDQIYQEISNHFNTNNQFILSKDCDLVLSFLSNEIDSVFQDKWNNVLDSIINIYQFKNWSFNLSSYPLIIRILCNLGRYDEAIQYFKRMESIALPIKTRTIGPLLEKLTNLESRYFNFLVEIFDKYKKVFTIDQFESLLELFNANFENPIIKQKLDQLLELWSQLDFVLNSRLIRLINNLKTSIQINFLKGVCSRCNNKIQKHTLSSNDREILVDQLMNVSLKNNKFQEWVNNFVKLPHSRLVIIDGGNVGHCINGVFSKDPIINLLNQLMESKTFDDQTIFLVVLHQSRKKEFKLSPLGCLVYYTPYNENDDLYWMFISFMIKDSLVITNDNLRDHHVDKLDETLFKRWKDNHLVTYSRYRDNDQFILNYPLEYTIGVQKTNDNRCHLPVQENDNLEWYCLE